MCIERGQTSTASTAMAAFLKLGDIRGEFVSNAVNHPNYRREKAVAQPGGLVIPTDGDDIVIGGIDRMTNVYVDGAIGGFQTDALTHSGPSQEVTEGYWDWSSEPTPHDLTSRGRGSYAGGGTATCDSNGTIGYETQPDEFFSHNPEWFAPGSAVDALGTSNPIGIEQDQIGGVISRGDMFAVSNELMSDSRF